MSRRMFRFACWAFAAAAVLAFAADGRAQNNNNNNNNNNGGGGGSLPAGVEVDADGVLRTRVFDRRLNQQRLDAARRNVAPNLARPSKLRMVSLNRLEAAVSERLANGEAPTEEMQFLAGLTRVKYVFYYPETQDIVIAGPAEPYGVDASGRAVGLNSGEAITQLEDLVVALRAFPPSGQRTRLVSVSIDPTQDGLKKMQDFLNRLGGRIPAGGANQIAMGLRQSLGNQVVTIQGVSPKTHFAKVLVEADYRMKLIGIGLEQPPVDIRSYTSRSNPRDVSRNALQRWYFVPNYECVKVGENDLAMELVGDGVKLISEDERVQANGGRVNANAVNRASQMFVQEFTAKYPQLAERSPVYGQLRNLIDLVIAAAFIQEVDYYGRAGWAMNVFGDEGQYAVETHTAPQQVESAVNIVWKGNTLMTPIGGGVHIEPRQALASQNRLADTDGELKTLHGGVDFSKVDAKQWWWD